MVTVMTPLSDAEWPQEVIGLLSGFAGTLNVYRVMARHPALLKAWERLRNHLVTNSSLDAERSEVVIIRAGIYWQSPYEIAHHLSRSRKLGFHDIRLERLCGPLEAIEGEDRLLANAVHSLLNHGRVDEASRDELVELLGPEGILDMMAIVGMYSTLAFIVNSFETPIDKEVLEA